jgi:hypothetical protein
LLLLIPASPLEENQGRLNNNKFADPPKAGNPTDVVFLLRLLKLIA